MATSAAEKTALAVARKMSENKTVKLSPAARRQVFTQQPKDATGLIKKINDLEAAYNNEFPHCAACDGVQHIAGDRYVTYGQNGKKRRGAGAKMFDQLRVIATDLANGKAVFITPNDLLRSAMSTAGVKAPAKKKGGKKKNK